MGKEVVFDYSKATGLSQLKRWLTSKNSYDSKGDFG